MPVVIRKISPFCSLRLFSPTSLQRAKNAHFSLIFPGKSAFWNGFKLRRFDVKKDFFFDLFLRFAAESSSDNFRFLLANSVSGGVGDKTRNAVVRKGTWVRIPPLPPSKPWKLYVFEAFSFVRAASILGKTIQMVPLVPRFVVPSSFYIIHTIQERCILWCPNGARNC